MIETRHLRNFVVLAEELHFRRAAERLRLAQPALSQSLRQLEEELGAQLVRRSTRRVELTPAGHNFHERAQQTLQSLEQAVVSTVRVARSTQKTLVFGFTSAGFYGKIPDLIRRFRVAAQDTQLIYREYSADALVAALGEGSVDVAALHGHLANPSLTGLVVDREACVLALPAQHRLARTRGSLRLTQLADEPLLVPQQTGFYGIYEIIIGACLQAGLTPVLHTLSPSMQTMTGLVAAGIGIALLPPSLALPRKGVVYRTIAGDPIEIELRLHWQRNNSAPGLALLRKLLRKGHDGMTNLH